MHVSTSLAHRTSLGSAPNTVGAARRYVREVLRSQRVDEKVTGIVELLTSEVVTNAFLHAHGAGELALTITGDTIRVEVDDPSGLQPIRQCAGGDALGGRGLAIVAALARAWGVEPKRQGKRVWFEVDRPPARGKYSGRRV
jgi:anti-sigma regulatory factor (Ser/Thr protein kinase)